MDGPMTYGPDRTDREFNGPANIFHWRAVAPTPTSQAMAGMVSPVELTFLGEPPFDHL